MTRYGLHIPVGVCTVYSLDQQSVHAMLHIAWLHTAYSGESCVRVIQ